MNHTFETLEFNKILQQLEELAYTRRAKARIHELVPYMSEREVKAGLRETTEARRFLDSMGNPPLVSLEKIEELLTIAEKEGCLSAEQLEYIEITLTAVGRMKDFLCKGKYLEIGIAYYEAELDPLEELKAELNHNIRNKGVEDHASKLLKDTREQIVRLDTKMRAKADSVLRANKDSVSDSFVTVRGGHLCIPVKKDCKFKISGSVIDKSATGATLFVEPTAVAAYQTEIQLLKLDEENEVRRILYTLTCMVADRKEQFLQNIHMMEKMDFMFAKGRLSVEMDAKEPTVNTERHLCISKGRHPLLDRTVCVPLDFHVGKESRGIIITGPNTGGKTVAVKTVGLYCLMAQSGLHLPCEKADICLNSQVLCDVGDGQSITENLSTFSSHITNAMSILRKVNQESLVIMDELGSGTDPAEGMGIAIAILDELLKSGCLYLVTTHYPEVKHYGEVTEGVQNARMAFDRENLSPLYRLEIGKSGESCAFYIAKRLGMPDGMLRRAALEAYGEEEPDGLSLDADQHLVHEHAPSVRKEKTVVGNQVITEKFRRGDSVMIYPDKKIGIVCQAANEKGVLQIQLQDKKIWVNHKRVKLHVAAAELYPADYDFSILFDSVETRKLRHQMEKKHCQDLEIRLDLSETQ